MLLNGQTSEWLSVKAHASQGPILVPFFPLVFINDLSDNLLSPVKLFADDISSFSVVNDSNISANELNKDLQKISEWAYKRKRSFNPDLNKQVQEVTFLLGNVFFFRKSFFNNAPVVCANWQNQLRMLLDECKP